LTKTELMEVSARNSAVFGEDFLHDKIADIIWTDIYTFEIINWI